MQKKKMWANFQRIIELLPKKLPQSPQKYGIGIRDPGSGKNCSGSRIQGSKRHRIRIRNTVNKYGTRDSGKRLGCIDVSTGVVTTGPAANQVVQHSEEPDKKKIHCKKSLAVFLSPAGMSLTKLSLGENNLIIPVQGEFG
jgi:hypothetical protein